MSILASLDLRASRGTTPWHRASALSKMLLSLGLLIGVLAALTLCLSLPFFTSAWASRVLLLREMKGVWDDLLTPFGKSLTLAEISALAALSGISEEIFFRGAVQGEIGILAVTVLTSLDKSDLEAMGYRGEVKDLVLARAAAARPGRSARTRAAAGDRPNCPDSLARRGLAGATQESSPSSIERRVAAATARVMISRNPLASSAASPASVVPPGDDTRSRSSAGLLPASRASFAAP